MENRVKQQRKRSVEESQGVCRSASGVFEVGRLETGYGGQLRMEVFARGIVGTTNLFTNDFQTAFEDPAIARRDPVNSHAWQIGVDRPGGVKPSTAELRVFQLRVDAELPDASFRKANGGIEGEVHWASRAGDGSWSSCSGGRCLMRTSFHERGPSGGWHASLE
ncbi:hypothetical protein OH76DRAFT_1418362 [Lentinus brumalis]|uniref:Uncharacterized protein n=1 Tax=Lentinus brumalis TaxID=2498619 RepID=A0A371DAQ1_9APHY|nr:hypothetical protein OH76DRAFT_1418362 [Polyporus brumalis]